MGYYDGPNLNEEHSETREVRKSGSKRLFFTGLVGAVVGAVWFCGTIYAMGSK